MSDSGGFIYYYYFDGSDGCDICDAMTGYYDDEPERPHPNCNCPIVDWVNYDYETVYKNKVEEEEETYEQSLEGVEEFVNNSNRTVHVSLKISETVTGSVEVGAEIEEIFEVSGKYEESESVEQTVERDLEPGEGISVDVIGIMKKVRFSAERWYVTEEVVGEEVQEIFDEEIEDEIEAVTGTRIEVNDI